MLLVALPQQLLLPTVNQLWQGSWQFHFGTIWGASIKLLTPTGLQLIIQSRRANELIKFKHPAFWTQLKLKLECLGRNRSLLRGHRLKCFSSIETWYHEIHVANWFLVASIKLGSFTLARAVFSRRKHLNVGIMEVDVVQLMLTTLLTEHELNLENFRKKWNFEQKKMKYCKSCTLQTVCALLNLNTNSPCCYSLLVVPLHLQSVLWRWLRFPEFCCLGELHQCQTRWHNSYKWFGRGLMTIT